MIEQAARDYVRARYATYLTKTRAEAMAAANVAQLAFDRLCDLLDETAAGTYVGPGRPDA